MRLLDLCSLSQRRNGRINRYFCSLMLEGKMDALVALSFMAFTTAIFQLQYCCKIKWKEESLSHFIPKRSHNLRPAMLIRENFHFASSN